MALTHKVRFCHKDYFFHKPVLEKNQPSLRMAFNLFLTKKFLKYSTQSTAVLWIAKCLYKENGIRGPKNFLISLKRLTVLLCHSISTPLFCPIRTFELLSVALNDERKWLLSVAKPLRFCFSCYCDIKSYLWSNFHASIPSGTWVIGESHCTKSFCFYHSTLLRVLRRSGDAI